MDFMGEAIKEAQLAAKLKEVPVGAVIVHKDKIIARAHNLKETLKDPTAHAELIAIRKACSFMGNWRLNDCELYVTLEPCAMCASAIAQCRLKRVYIGAHDMTGGACGTVIDILNNDYLNYTVDIKWQYNEECSIMLKNFFKSRR